MKRLISEAGYFVVGIVMFCAACVAFYLIWALQTQVITPFISDLF